MLSNYRFAPANVLLANSPKANAGSTCYVAVNDETILCHLTAMLAQGSQVAITTRDCQDMAPMCGMFVFVVMVEHHRVICAGTDAILCSLLYCLTIDLCCVATTKLHAKPNCQIPTTL